MLISRSSILAALVLGAALTGCVVSSDDDDIDTGSTMTIANRSSYVLTEVHLADIDDPTWGPDLLPDVLYPGEDLVITDIRCGRYDVMVVDETDVACTLTDVELCVSSDVWVIDDVTLDVCAFSQRLTPPSRTQDQTDATSTSAELTPATP